MSIITDYMEEFYSVDYPEAKFKIGREAIYNSISPSIPEMNGKKFIVTGVNRADDENDKPVFEYSLQGFPYLVWENELEIPKDATYCKKCGAPKTKFKCDYCLV